MLCRNTLRRKLPVLLKYCKVRIEPTLYSNPVILLALISFFTRVMTQLRWMVTGCSSGIGDMMVQSILARGDKVVATARGDLSRLSSLKELGAEVFSLDVTDSGFDLKAVVAEILADGPIDVLVNNAGYIEAGIAEETRYVILNFADGSIFSFSLAMRVTWPNLKPTSSASSRLHRQFCHTSGKENPGRLFSLDPWEAFQEKHMQVP